MISTFTHKSGELEVQASIEKYPLKLRTAFGTAHSLTTERLNALISFKVGDKVGYGEVGLPPKKPYCYKADFNDVVEFFASFQKAVSQVQEGTYDPFHELPPQYFAPIRPTSASDSVTLLVFKLFKALDTCEGNNQEYGAASKSGVEMALLDLLGKHLNLPIYKMLGHEAKPSKSFYTIGLTPTLEPMLESADFGLKYTNLLKIKLDNDVERGCMIVHEIENYINAKGGNLSHYSIDANASWTPESSRQYLQKLIALKDKLYMMEQPFNPEFLKVGPPTTEEDAAWREVKQVYTAAGVPIFADESVSTYKDVKLLQPYVHGVNIKMEKAGGLRGVIRAVHEAKELGLRTWIGTMVGSCLNSVCAAHVMCSLADSGGDLDGGLLITEESQKFSGGFVWKGDGNVVLGEEPGVGVITKV